MPGPSDNAITISGLPLVENASIRSMVMSLEHYRLKRPGILSEADTQGLRHFKGRQFVDIALDEIVQVRQDAITGEYRATLPSEHIASGPSLVLDRRTMIWRAEHDPILSRISNVLNTQPDHGFTAFEPSIKLNPADAQGRLYEGRDDAFERRAALNAPIVARGLDQFTQQHAAILRTELSGTQQIFADAKRAISAGYVEAEGIFQGYFGEHHEFARSRFADCLARGEALSVEYQGPWGMNKFVAVEFDQERSAWMYPLDFHGRFFMGQNAIQAGEFAAVLGHEMMHMRRVNRFKSVGPGALDYFYLDARLGNALGHPVPAYDIPERGVSEVIMRGGLSAAYLEGFTSDHGSFIAGVSESLGLAGKLDVQTAVDLFNASPAVRTQMASNNADSIIYSAKSLHELHLARSADSRLLSSLLER